MSLSSLMTQGDTHLVLFGGAAIVDVHLLVNLARCQESLSLQPEARRR